MKTTITKRLQAIIIMSLSLITHSTDLNGRENESFLARPIAWASSIMDQFRTTRRKIRTEIPKERLAYQAAQVNSAVSQHITQEERAILIKNLGYFKQLVANAKDVEAARTLMISIILPEQRGKAQRPLEGVSMYTEKFTEEADKQFFCSTTGRQSLQQVLMHAPAPQQNISRVQYIQQHNHLMQLLQKQLNQKESQLVACEKKVTLAKNNPKVIAALEAIANDPVIDAKQKRLVELKELLEKKSENPELLKVIDLVQAKNEELTDKMAIIMQNPKLSQGQKQKEAQALLAEYELFLSNFPPAKEFFELLKESVIVQTELQELTHKNTKKYPELTQYAKLLQLRVKIAEEYQKLIGAAQGVPTLVQKQVAAYNAKLWCVQLDQWFNACIEALETNAQPENHILSREHEMKAQTAEWHAVIEGHKDLEAYLAYHEINKKSYGPEHLKKQYARLDKTLDDIKNETVAKISHALDLPKDSQASLKVLDIHNITESDLLPHHRTLIKKQFRQSSKSKHPDKEKIEDAQTSQANQILINEANTQLNNLLDYAPLTDRQAILQKACDALSAQLSKEFSGNLSIEQQEEKARIQEKLSGYQKLQEVIKEELAHPDILLANEHFLANREIKANECYETLEERYKRKVQENKAFQRNNPKAYYNTVFEKVAPSTLQETIEHIDYFGRPSQALTVRNPS